MQLRYYEDEHGCWIPISHARDADGYVLYKGKRAHQVMYERVHGRIPKGMVVRHTCNRGHEGCCNPEHLILGTQAENVQDRVDAGRSARGAANGNSKLTDEQVEVIRTSEEAATVLAERLGCSPSLVRAIRRGDRRKIPETVRPPAAEHAGENEVGG